MGHAHRDLERERPAGAHGLHHVAGRHFVTVYCPNGKTLDHPDFPLKLAWFDALRDYLAGVDRDAALVVGGDFNIVPAALD